MPKSEPPRRSGRGPRPLWIYGIRARIFLSMAALAAVLLASAAFWIERQARSELEGELTLRLQAIGTAAASIIGPGMAPALLSLSPANASFVFYRDRRTALTQLRDQTGVRRIFLADTTGRSYVDTDLRVSIGAPLTQLRSDRVEMRAVRQGRPAAAALFTDEGGQIRKTGYVPLVQGERVVGLIGVEADATFLRAVRTLRTRVIGIGLAGILASFLLAALVAGGLTGPLNRLVAWAGALGDGDLSRTVPAEGRDEIGFLAGTLERMRERLEARDREQRAMVAGVAHEIRNPLGGIRLYAELLAEDPEVTEAARGRLRKILRELDQLGAIVDEFLLYARPAVPAPEDVALAEAVPELLDALAPQAARRGIRLRPEEPAGGWPSVHVDPLHFRQIVRNLLLNAIDASPPEGIVTVRCLRDPGGWSLEVEDQGPGIPAADREKVFEPFFTTKAAGAGLGLPIVRRLALLNGVRIEVAAGSGAATKGTEGPGARFRVVFGSAPPGRADPSAQLVPGAAGA